MIYYFKLIRPLNLFFLLFSMWILVFSSINNVGFIEASILSFTYNGNYLIFISILLSAAFGYAINDFYDIEADKINKPQKQIIDVQISRKNSLIFISFLFIASILLSLSYHIQLFYFVLIFNILLWLYSYSLKKITLIGNIIISICSCASFIIVGLFSNNLELHLMSLIYAFFAFFTTLIREIIKDMEDIDGDRIIGCNTIAIRFSFKTIKLMLSILLIFTVVSHIYIISHYINNIAISSVYSIFIIAFGYFLYNRINIASIKNDFSELSKWIKYFMLVGVLSILLIKYF